VGKKSSCRMISRRRVIHEHPKERKPLILTKEEVKRKIIGYGRRQNKGPAGEERKGAVLVGGTATQKDARFERERTTKGKQRRCSGEDPEERPHEKKKEHNAS